MQIQRNAESGDHWVKLQTRCKSELDPIQTLT
jgi:hypothetical protein